MTAGKMRVHIWIILSLTTILITCCFGSPTMQRYNRAVPDYKLTPTLNKKNNSEDLAFKEFWLQKNKELCPFGQVPQRSNSVCCYVTVCGPDHEIEECSVNGTEDKCSKCKPGFLQYHNISSLDMEDAKCFKELPKHKNCPLGDMRPAREILNENFPEKCECKLEVCYIEVKIGSCSKRKACGRGLQLNKTGTCEPCPWYGYKNSAGCQPCTINVTLLRQGEPGGIYTSPKLGTTAVTKVSEETLTNNLSIAPLDKPGKESEKKDGLDTVYIILLAVIATALVVIMLSGMYKCYKRRMSSGSATAPPTPSADNAPLLPGQTLVIPTHIEDRNGYGNILYQPNNNSLARNNKNNADNFSNGHAVNGYAGNKHFHDNLRGENHTADSELKVLGGEHHFSLEEERNQLQNGGVQFPTNVENHERKREIRSNKSASKQKEDQAEKMSIQQAVLMDRMQNETEQGQDRVEEKAVESVQGAVGGTVDDIYDNVEKNIEDEPKVTKEKDKNKTKSAVSFHQNEFNNCRIHINGNGKTKIESLTSVSGTYELDSSCDSPGVSSAPTVWLPGRGNVGQNKENSSNDTNKLEWKDEPSCRDKLCEIRERDVPPCRPELSKSLGSGSPGCNIHPREEFTSNDADKDMAEKDAKPVQDKVEDENHQIPGQQEEAEIAKPFQPAVARERRIARVLPIRQNSEVHVSGYPSEGLNNDESNRRVQSVRSMSYAFMHYDSDLDAGYMLSNVADLDDSTEVGENGDQHPQNVNPESMQNSGGQSRFLVGEERCVQTSYMQRTCNAVAPTRLGINQTGLNNSVAPVGEREGPEGNSVTYTPENDQFVSRPDIQETDRKVAADEIDSDVTEEKLYGNNNTGAKIVDIDDEVTECKRKIKAAPHGEKETDLKKAEDSVSEDSVEINKTETENQCNVEDILYEEDEMLEVKDSLTEEDVGTNNEKSFEIVSADYRNINNFKNASDDITQHEVVNSDDVSQSFEIYSKDFKNSEKLNEEVSSAVNKAKNVDTEAENRSVGQTEESFELDRNDIEQINNNGALCCPEDSAETSFEINSSEIDMFDLRDNTDVEAGDNTDVGEASDRTAESDESVDVKTEVEVD